MLSATMQAASKSHLDQKELSQKDKKKLKTLEKWLSNGNTKFEEAGGIKRCVDSQLRLKLYKLFTTVDFA